jgi:glutamate-5-semialdehyde dehydrogenase
MKTIKPLVERTKNASEVFKTLDITVSNAVLHDMADALIEYQDIIIKLNDQDIANSKAMRLSPLAIDRLLLNSERITELATSIRYLATKTSILTLKDDDEIKISSPSTLAIVYESRPHITAEAACLAFRSGNAIILRGGKEAFHSNTAISSILCDVLEQNGLPRELITLLPTSDRVSMTELISLNNLIDHVITHGSEGLIKYVQKNSKIPVLSKLPEIQDAFKS